MRTSVYVDGFNLYYGAVKGTPFKWLNPVELARRALPAANKVERVKYFTARVSGAADPDAPRRQHVYLLALDTLPEVEIIYGHFLSKTIWRPITNFPVAGAQIRSPVSVSIPSGNHRVDGGSLNVPATLQVSVYPPRGMPRAKGVGPLGDALVAEVHAMEEKGSDVNLAAHLLNDAWKARHENRSLRAPATGRQVIDYGCCGFATTWTRQSCRPNWRCRATWPGIRDNDPAAVPLRDCEAALERAHGFLFQRTEKISRFRLHRSKHTARC